MLRDRKIYYMTDISREFLRVAPKKRHSRETGCVNGNGSMLKGVSRLAANMDNTKLAVVVSE